MSQKKIGTSRLDNESLWLPNKTTNINKSCVDIDTTKLWHFRMGHLSYDRLKFFSSYYSNISIGYVHPCDACLFAKQKRLPFPFSSTKSTQFFDLLHVDIWGPFNHVFVEGYKYFWTVLDYFTRYTWICLMKTNAETHTHLRNFINKIENQFNCHLKVLRSDNDPEFLMTDFFNWKGIFIKLVVWKLHNKIVLLNANICWVY